MHEGQQATPSFLNHYSNRYIMDIKAILTKDTAITENSQQARELYEKSNYGTILADGRIKLSLLEAVYLTEKNKITVLDGKNKPISLSKLTDKAEKKEHDFWTRYPVFRDFRNRGYIIKTALKFGADFRIYERGTKPGQEHAKWIVYPVKESQKLTWQDYAAKNRVAHSTKKRLLIAVVDDEGDVSYWEARWIKP